MKKVMLRQGDVLLVKTMSKLEGGEKVKPEHGRLILARGEATGHHHSVSVETCELIMKGDQMQLVVQEPATLSHQEHVAIEIQPGLYWVVRQREYHPKEVRRVQD